MWAEGEGNAEGERMERLRERERRGGDSA